MRDFPGLYKNRVGVYWLDKVHRGKRYQESLRTKNGETARVLYKRRVQEIELGVSQSSRTLEQWIVLFLSSLRSRKEDHRDELERIVRGFVDDTGAARPQDMSGAAAQEWLDGYGQSRHASARAKGPPSARTLSKYAQHLKQFGRFLVKHRRESGLSDSPFEPLSFTWSEADRRYERRSYLPDELHALLLAAPPYRAMVYMTSALTGLRREELGSILWCDVDLGGRWLQIRAEVTKNKRRVKRHPLPEALAELLQQHKERRVSAKGRGRTIPHYRGGREPTDALFPVIPDVPTLRDDVKAAGFSWKDPSGKVLDFHSLRYSYAALLELHRVGLSTAQKLMRHCKPELTSNIYQALEHQELAAAIAPLAGIAAELAQAAGKSTGNHPEEPPGMAGCEATSGPDGSASNEPKLLAGATGNRIQRRSCSLRPTVLKRPPAGGGTEAEESAGVAGAAGQAVPPPGTHAIERTGTVLRLGQSPEARALAELLVRATPEQRRALVLLAHDDRLQLGVIRAAIDRWPEAVPPPTQLQPRQAL